MRVFIDENVNFGVKIMKNKLKVKKKWIYFIGQWENNFLIKTDFLIYFEFFLLEKKKINANDIVIGQ